MRCVLDLTETLAARGAFQGLVEQDFARYCRGVAVLQSGMRAARHAHQLLLLFACCCAELL